MKIIKASIGPWPRSMFDPMPKVTVTFEDGTEKVLFSFYPDEIMFHEKDFVGLTEKEAKSLHHARDVAYLRS
jgi:hypothetical protein